MSWWGWRGGAKHWMPFICFPLCRSSHKPGISGCSHTRITPSCILSEWNSRVDVTEWQDPPADRNLVPTPQEPGQAVSDQEVWRGGVSSSNDVDKPSTPSPHPTPAPRPTLCCCVCRLVDSLTIIILTLHPPGGDSSSTSHLLQLDWPVWLMYVSQKCLFNQLLKQSINQFHNQIFKQFCCFVLFCFFFTFFWVIFFSFPYRGLGSGTCRNVGNNIHYRWEQLLQYIFSIWIFTLACFIIFSRPLLKCTIPRLSWKFLRTRSTEGWVWERTKQDCLLYKIVCFLIHNALPKRS